MKIDLLDVYEQIWVASEEIMKIAFVTIYGTLISYVMQQRHFFHVSITYDWDILRIHWNICSYIFKWYICVLKLSCRTQKAFRIDIPVA